MKAFSTSLSKTGLFLRRMNLETNPPNEFCNTLTLQNSVASSRLRCCAECVASQFASDPSSPFIEELFFEFFFVRIGFGIWNGIQVLVKKANTLRNWPRFRSMGNNTILSVFASVCFLGSSTSILNIRNKRTKVFCEESRTPSSNRYRNHPGIGNAWIVITLAATWSLLLSSK